MSNINITPADLDYSQLISYDEELSTAAEEAFEDLLHAICDCCINSDYFKAEHKQELEAFLASCPSDFNLVMKAREVLS